MTPPVSRSAVRPNPAGYTKFSDKLTDSLDDITKMINDHKGMIDAIQEVSLELTETFGSLHDLTVKYAGKANQILDVLLPIVKGLPIIPQKVKVLLVDLEAWTQKIIDNQKETSRTITEVRTGLKTGDVSRLKEHAADLKKVTNTLTKILPNK